MTQSSYPERRGAHRPPGLGPAGAIPWFIAAVAVFAIVAYAAGWWGGGDSDGTADGVVTAPVSTSKAKPSGTANQGSSTPKAGTPSSSAPSSSTASTSSATVDPTQPVTVLNATKTPGLAAGAASRLRSAGWTIDSTGNYRSTLAATTVFYGKASLAATAAAVAGDLGGKAAVQESADFGATKVTVVLAADYQS
jgi:hypothetical protein